MLVGVFMLNAVASSLSATGAFEIYLGGAYVYNTHMLMCTPHLSSSVDESAMLVPRH